MEQDVLDEINIRTECLMEMFQIVEQTAAEKPDEAMVNQIQNQFKIKSQDLRNQLKDKFKAMRAKLKVQEQMVDAILKKNLTYIEHELKNLKSLDYSKFNEAERWLKSAKVKLDNFQANNNNPNYIAFDMLANAKSTEFNDGGEDDLLADEDSKNMDIIVHGEKIADVLGKVKTINPNLLASQLNQLNLQFEEQQIDALNTFAKCTAIEGVEISQEELEALKEAINQAEGGDINDDKPMDDPFVVNNQQKGMEAHLSKLQNEMENMNLNQKRQPDLPIQPDVHAQPFGQPDMGIKPMNQNFGNELPQEMNQPQNQMMEETDTGGELDPEFLGEIETYLKECMENNELSIDMSDTLIKDHGAKMVAAAASLCDNLQELRLQQCGVTDEGAIELFNELACLRQLQVIDLSFNPISERALDSLTKLLNVNQNLVVNMRMNAIKNKFAARKMANFEQQGRLNIQNQ